MGGCAGTEKPKDSRVVKDKEAEAAGTAQQLQKDASKAAPPIKKLT